MYSTDTVQNKPAAVAPKENHHHHFFVSGIGQKKTVDATKNLYGGTENVVKTETQQTFVNGLLGFITLGHLYSRKRVCIAHNNCMSCPSIWAALSTLLINILGSFQLFLHSDQPLSEGEIIPFSGVCQSGRLHYPRRRRWWPHWLTDCFDVQPTTTSGNIITQSIIFSFSIS